MKIIAGVDEVGRGSLVGPVYAAAVILNKNIDKKLLKDSKIISKVKRELLSNYIKKNSIWVIGKASVKEIDKINILNASILAMQKCVGKLKVEPEFLLVDGNKFKKYKNIPHKTIVKGDQKYMNIAAASILAKNARDNYMNKLHEKFPQYSWLTNKGYPTKAHKQAIIKFGITKYHRKSFKLYDEQLLIDF